MQSVRKNALAGESLKSDQAESGAGTLAAPRLWPYRRAMLQLLLIGVGCLVVAAGCGSAPDEGVASSADGVDAKSCAILGLSTDGKEQSFVFHAADVPSPDATRCKKAGSWAYSCELSVCLPKALPLPASCADCRACPVCK